MIGLLPRGYLGKKHNILRFKLFMMVALSGDGDSFNNRLCKELMTTICSLDSTVSEPLLHVACLTYESNFHP